MTTKGYVKLHRKAIDSRVFSDADLWRHWTWLLMRANHKERFFEGETIGRGSLVAGTRSTAEILGSSPATVHRQWKRLAEWGMVVLNVKRAFTIITICNYETYNPTPPKGETQMKRKRNAGETPVKHARNADETLVKPTKNYQEGKELEELEEVTPLPPKGEPVPQLPPSIRTPEMIAAVESWLAYKAERREKYKPQGLKALYARIANVAGMHGPATVIELMERAKASGWKGWDHQEPTPKGRTPPKGGSLFDATDPRGTFAAASNYLSGGD